jgi:hypothetical protein
VHPEQPESEPPAGSRASSGRRPESPSELALIVWPVARKPGKGERIMASKRTKSPQPSRPDPVEISTSDRELLAQAYRAGLILSWKADAERGFRLTLAGRGDEYVEVTKLPRYLAGLRGAA